MSGPVHAVTQSLSDRGQTLFEVLIAQGNLVFESRLRWPTEITAADLDAIEGEVLFRETFREASWRIVKLEDALAWLDLDGGSLLVRACGPSAAAAEGVVEAILKIAPRSVMSGDALRIVFWSLAPNGPVSTSRKVTAPAMEAIAGNYSAGTWAALERLRTMRFDESNGGKLILWHGEPGTGKTWALRALAREWRTWLELHYIVDPERLFGQEAAYLVQVLLGEAGPVEVIGPSRTPPGHPEQKWRLIILEDTGELLTRDAKERSGQGLSRLLNTCDGLIGQGLRVLVLITTNEDLGQLHPAVTRPGRCVANVGFTPLSDAEAARWCDRRGVELDGSRARTLAELYAIGAGESSPVERRVVGFR